MALGQPSSECPRSDSVARVEVERVEAGETLTQAQTKEIVDRAVISTPGTWRRRCSARDEADRRVVGRGADPSKYRFPTSKVRIGSFASSSFPLRDVRLPSNTRRRRRGARLAALGQQRTSYGHAAHS
jgi:hypothetical protein